MNYKKISLSDIAEKLGVSKTLVSMVLNGKGDEMGISKSTQEKVLKLAEELKFKPNQYARGFRIGKTNTIGLVLSDISNPICAKIARYIEDFCSNENYNLIICNSDEKGEKEKRIIETLIEKQVDGIIISSTLENADLLRKLKDENIPFILIDRIFSSYSTHYVIADNYKSAFEATQYLIEQGHKKIACFNISPAHISSQVERFLGYKNAIENSLLSFYDYYHKAIDKDNLYKSIYSVLRDWANSRLMPTAIVSAHNQITLTLLEVCKELQINIPSKLSIISFDDIDTFRFTTPSITAVVQPVESIAKYASEYLMKLIKLNKINEEFGELFQVKLEPNLVLRDSVAKFK